jgi:hypothetical protein
MFTDMSKRIMKISKPKMTPSNSESTKLIRRMVRVPDYALAKSMSGMQVRNLISAGVIPAVVIKRLILIDPIEADAALEQFKRGAKKQLAAAK